MLQVRRFGTNRLVASAVLMFGIAVLANDAMSDRVVSDAQAATITGGQQVAGCVAYTFGTGANSCSTGCPTENNRGSGTGGTACINVNATCPDCGCTYSGVTTCTITPP